MTTPIRLLLADVDGTLVTSDKVLTERAIEAVHRLHQAGIGFAVTSGRPPRGMAMLVEPLRLQTPIAAFNGGVITHPDMTVVEQRVIPDDLVVPIADLIGSFGLDVWVYRGADWYVPDLGGRHVDRESWTVKFQPKVMTGVADVAHEVAKIVGVSDDHAAVAKATAAAHDRFGDHVAAATSQPYYLDVTHPDANKGAVANYLAHTYKLSTDQIATIGDMPNDVLMFAHSGLSIAMGNADNEVKRAARRVTDGNDDEGFAKAVERFILRDTAQRDGLAPRTHRPSRTATRLDRRGTHRSGLAARRLTDAPLTGLEPPALARGRRPPPAPCRARCTRCSWPARPPA